LLPCQPDQTYGIEPAADFSKFFHSEAVFVNPNIENLPGLAHSCWFKLEQIGLYYFHRVAKRHRKHPFIKRNPGIRKKSDPLHHPFL
jgi:hypothetical protein